MDEIPIPEAVSISCLVRTTTKTRYPTVAAVFYYCQVLSTTGTELEGAPVVKPGDHLFALNLGTAIPPEGTTLEVLFVRESQRWVFRYDE